MQVSNAMAGIIVEICMTRVTAKLKVCPFLNSNMTCDPIISGDNSSRMAFTILIRLCIFLLLAAVLRLLCILCGWCRAPSPRERRVQRSNSRAPRVVEDEPPPYPGTPIQRMVRSWFTKPETPPPSYKTALNMQSVLSDSPDSTTERSSTPHAISWGNIYTISSNSCHIWRWSPHFLYKILV